MNRSPIKVVKAEDTDSAHEEKEADGPRGEAFQDEQKASQKDAAGDNGCGISDGAADLLGDRPPQLVEEIVREIFGRRDMIDKASGEAYLIPFLTDSVTYLIVIRKVFPEGLQSAKTS